MMISPSQLPRPTPARKSRAAGNHCHSSSASGPAPCPSAADPSAADPAAAAAAAGQAGNCQKNDAGSHPAQAGDGNYYPPGGSVDPSDENQSDGGLDGADASAQQSQRLGKVVKEWHVLFDEAKQLLVQLRSDEHNAHRLADCHRALVRLAGAYALDDSTGAADLYARNLQSFIDSVLAFASSPKTDDEASGAEEDRAEATTSRHDAGEACVAECDAECADVDPFADNDVVVVDPHKDGRAMAGTVAEVESGMETTGDAADPHSSVAKGEGEKSVHRRRPRIQEGNCSKPDQAVSDVTEDSEGEFESISKACGNMHRIFGTHATMAAEKATELLAKLTISQDGRSASFEEIYRDACRFNWDGQKIKEKLIEEGVLTGSGTLAPALPVHNLHSGCSTTTKSRPTLVYILVRWSPNTKNKGYTQLIRIIVALFYLAMKGEEFEVHPVVFAGPEVKRDESHKSGGIEQLFQSLRITPDDRKVLVLANEVLRISDEPVQVDTFQRSVKALQPTAEAKTLKEHGLDLVRAVSTLATEASQRRNICATVGNHIGAGREADVDPALRPTRERVEQLACEIRSDIESYKSVITDAAKRGESIICAVLEENTARRWRKALKSVEQKEGTAEEAAADLILDAREELSQSLGNCRKQRIYLYLRTSPGTGTHSNGRMICGLPLDQLASCLARAMVEYGDSVFSEYELIIFHDAGKDRSNKCNAAFAKLLSQIIRGGPAGVIFPNTNRISERPRAIELLDAVFAHKDIDAKPHFSRLVGQDHSAVAQKEGHRREGQRNVVDERKRKNENQRKEDISCPEKRAQSDVLQTISGIISFPGVVIPRKEWDHQAELAKQKREEEKQEKRNQAELGKRKRAEEKRKREEEKWYAKKKSAVAIAISTSRAQTDRAKEIAAQIMQSDPNAAKEKKSVRKKSELQRRQADLQRKLKEMQQAEIQRLQKGT